MAAHQAPPTLGFSRQEYCNTWKQTVFVCSSNNQFKNKNWKPILIYNQFITWKIKSLEINLIRHRKDTENCKALMRLIKEDLSKWRKVQCPWTRWLNVIKTSKWGEGGSKGRRYMYDYDGFALLYIQQKPIQHCKANFLQLKNKYNIKGQNSPNWSMKSI